MGTLTERERETFRRIADHLVPEAEGMPSASQVGVHACGLDRILSLRPELEGELRRALDAATDLEGASAARFLNGNDPEGFGTVALIASSAYYMAPEVHVALGYPGQQSRPVAPEEEGDYLVDDLLQPVIDRGPIYRPTPD
jgi:hypothetical protein